MRVRENYKFDFKPFSPKSKEVINVHLNHIFDEYDGIIAIGAVRSSKTFSIAIGQVFYVCATADNTLNLWGGVSKEAIQENYVNVTISILRSLGLRVRQVKNIVIVKVPKNHKWFKPCVNRFEIKGGDTKRSHGTIQGRTYYTIFIDEVLKVERSYYDMARSRLTYKTSKQFYTGNPEGPGHWVKKDIVDRAEELKLYHTIFVLDDNWSLAEEVKERYKRMFTGVFYQRMILSKWVAAEGIIFDIPEENKINVDEIPQWGELYLSLDYGTSNALNAGLYQTIDRTDYKKAKIYKIDEYSYSGRERQKFLTNSEYIEEIEKFLEKYDLTFEDLNAVIIDPSALAFKTELQRAGAIVIDAINDVENGILVTQTFIKRRQLMFSTLCKKTFEEAENYVWDEKATEKGEDKPIKKGDHAMDETRYMIATLFLKDFQSGLLVSGGVNG
ncbi:MAG: PBSX family phage terminase large subunit [Fusobacteriales bacterium]|nr:PBSX family phage terminase large subunit [Fusobacteriales bacterium]